ncbi:MAG: phage portal protein [Rhodospirillaceae bacterium]
MGLLTKFFAKDEIETKGQSFTLADPAAMSLLFGAQQTAAGASITPETAMHCPTVAACVKVLSESVAQLPLVLYKRSANGGKEKATDHPLYELLANQPNDWTSSFEFRINMQAALSLYGNTYAFVNRDSAGIVKELIYIPPTCVFVTVDTVTMEPSYRVTNLDGSSQEYNRTQVLHIRNIGVSAASHGYVGASPVMQIREAIGLSFALEEHAARLFSNGARPGGLFEYGKQLSDKVLERLRNSLSSLYSGAANSGKTIVLEDGMKFTPLQFSSVDSEFMALRHFQVVEIARAYRIPLHKLADLVKSSFSNIETQSNEFLSDCLLPILKNWEGVIRRTLLTAEERAEGYYVEFNFDDLIRADIAKRFLAYASAITNGVLNPNECREMENRPSYVGGEVFTRQLNTGPTNTAETNPTVAP